jgi:hypothetical protein
MEHKSVDVFQIEQSGTRKYLTTINARGEENLRNYLEKQGIRAVFLPKLSDTEKAEMAAITSKLTQSKPVEAPAPQQEPAATAAPAQEQPQRKAGRPKTKNA